MSTMKKHSRQEFTSNNTVEHIRLGTLQRIADATEKMALRYTELIDKAERLQCSNDFLRGLVNQRNKTASNLHGQITKLKKKLAVKS